MIYLSCEPASCPAPAVLADVGTVSFSCEFTRDVTHALWLLPRNASPRNRLLGRPHPHRRGLRLRVREGGRRAAHPRRPVLRPVRLVRVVAARGVLRVRAVCGGRRGGGRAAVHLRRVRLRGAAENAEGADVWMRSCLWFSDATRVERMKDTLSRLKNKRTYICTYLRPVSSFGILLRHFVLWCSVGAGQSLLLGTCLISERPNFDCRLRWHHARPDLRVVVVASCPHTVLSLVSDSSQPKAPVCFGRAPLPF